MDGSCSARCGEVTAGRLLLPEEARGGGGDFRRGDRGEISPLLEMFCLSGLELSAGGSAAAEGCKFGLFLRAFWTAAGEGTEV